MPFDQIITEVIDRPLRTEIDVATNASYTYVAVTQVITAQLTDPVWRVHRIENATGSRKYARNPDTGVATDQPVLQASAAATYAY